MMRQLSLLPSCSFPLPLHPMFSIIIVALQAVSLLLLTAPSYRLFAQSPPATSLVTDQDRKRGHAMLKTVRQELKDKYYDKSFHGLDLDARFRIADERIDQATSVGQIYGIIARAVLDLNDSHTFFIPPPWKMYADYGWRMQIVGNACRVTSVLPASDAEAKGLKVGEEILSIDGVSITRENIALVQYLYNILRPQLGMRVVVQVSPTERRNMEIQARIEQGQETMTVLEYYQRQIGKRASDLDVFPRLDKFGKDLFALRLPTFEIAPEQIDYLLQNAQAFKTLVLDLRGNGGGYEIALQRLVGLVFPRDVKIADVKQRNGVKEVWAKAQGRGSYTGKLIVLIDSESASAAEIFARVIQLEKRGIVIGDRTSGQVMQSIQYSFKIGDNSFLPYGLSITNADLIMSDGKSLERVGVIPDELLLPTKDDMAAGRDVVLAYAAQLAGVTLDAAKAGSLFPKGRITPVIKEGRRSPN